MKKVRIELEDGTVWVGEITENNTVLIDETPEYLDYYEWFYGGGNGYPTPVDNEYQLNEVKILNEVLGK